MTHVDAKEFDVTKLLTPATKSQAIEGKKYVLSNFMPHIKKYVEDGGLIASTLEKVVLEVENNPSGEFLLFRPFYSNGYYFSFAYEV